MNYNFAGWARNYYIKLNCLKNIKFSGWAQIKNVFKNENVRTVYYCRLL